SARSTWRRSTRSRATGATRTRTPSPTGCCARGTRPSSTSSIRSWATGRATTGHSTSATRPRRRSTRTSSAANGWTRRSSACGRGRRRHAAGDLAPPMTVAGVQQPAAEAETPGFYVELYRRMRLIRRFEDLVQTLFLRGEVYGTTHLYSGQEAVGVGFASTLQEGDRVACTYRGHGHLLAMGTEPEKLLAELLGRATGVNGGRAGSMNIVDLERG